MENQTPIQQAIDKLNAKSFNAIRGGRTVVIDIDDVNSILQALLPVEKKFSQILFENGYMHGHYSPDYPDFETYYSQFENQPKDGAGN